MFSLGNPARQRRPQGTNDSAAAEYDNKLRCLLENPAAPELCADRAADGGYQLTVIGGHPPHHEITRVRVERTRVPLER
jgi:hypothetical protein